MQSKRFSLMEFKQKSGLDISHSIVLTVDGVSFMTRRPSLVPKLLKEIEKKYHKKASIEVVPPEGLLTV